MKGDFVVVLHLVGDLGHAGAGDRSQVVIPPVDALARLAVVRRPAEVGRIDIGGQPGLEAVQLIRTHEVHLARETGGVAGATQVVRPGRHGGAKFGGVVVDAGTRGQLARHEGRPPRRAQVARRVGVVEIDRAPGQLLQVGRVQKVRRPILEQRAVHLIRHQHQNIRSRHAPSPASLYWAFEIRSQLARHAWISANDQFDA